MPGSVDSNAIWLDNESMHYEMATKNHPYDISWLLKLTKWWFAHLHPTSRALYNTAN